MRRNVQENNRRRKDKNTNENANAKKTAKSKIEGVKQKIKNIQLDKKKITILAVCVIVIIGIIVVNNYTALGLVLNRNIDRQHAVELQVQTTIEEIIPFGNEILVCSKGKIDIYNNYGKNTATIKLEDSAEATISTSGEYIQVLNKDKNIVYVYKNKYEVARIKLDGKIHSANINTQGTSVIEYSSNGNKIILGIYDNSGNIKYNIRPSNNIIGKYVLSDNSKYLAYTDVDISGISAYTNVNLIDLSNIKENESNSNIIYTLDNALAYDIYWDGGDVVTRFDNAYVVYNTTSKKSEHIKISEGQVIDIGDYENRFAYTELDSRGNYLLMVRKMSSDKVKTVELNDVPKYFEYENGVIYVCYSKSIEAYNNSGVNIKNYTSDIVITRPVIFNNGRSAAMAISNRLIMFTI